MIFFATIKIAARALRRNKMRSLLTMLGIIIGVGAVIAMVSIGNGAKAQVEQQIAQLGQNVLLVMAGNANRGGVRMGFGSASALTKDDYEAIRREIPDIAGASPEVRVNGQLAAANQNIATTILGVSPDYVNIRFWPIVNGANFTEQDVKRNAKVCIIGQTTASNLFGAADPVGQIVRVKNAPFVVVGLLASKGMSMNGSDQDDILLVPYSSAMVRLSSSTTFRNFNIQASNAKTLDSVQQQVTDLLRQRHRISGDKEDDFMVRSTQEISDAQTATSRTMTYLLAAIASVSLLVGGIGIMNIMLVSVTERTREIGIRLAVGARGRDILMQFLIEAVALSVVGGTLGVLTGVTGSHLVTYFTGWVTYISTDSILYGFLFSAVIGIFFGFYPARKAARLDPIDALRYE
jgi:putative ABC transport system permease protein